MNISPTRVFKIGIFAISHEWQTISLFFNKLEITVVTVALLFFYVWCIITGVQMTQTTKRGFKNNISSFQNLDGNYIINWIELDKLKS